MGFRKLTYLQRKIKRNCIQIAGGKLSHLAEVVAQRCSAKVFNLSWNLVVTLIDVHFIGFDLKYLFRAYLVQKVKFNT